MEENLKGLFGKVLNIIKQNKKIYEDGPRKTSRDGNKFTVLSLYELACNHLFDDCPNLFGISQLDGHRIRAYFYRYNPETFICELYKEFPGIFDGESREECKWKNYKLPKEIPLFD